MTIAKLVSIFLLTLTTVSCQAESPPVKLDYEKLILLDAENLAETGIGAAYDELLPELKHYISNPEQIEQFIDNDLPRYAIRSNGAEYVIYAPDMPENESWGAATYVFFKIVNDQLADTQVRLYAINGGNDLGGLFLTHEQARAAQVSLPNPSDWPYLPEANGPWYGQHH